MQCVVTSPPYWGLRDYGTAPLVWGGDPACEHEWGDVERSPWANAVPGPNGIVKNTEAGHWKPKEHGQWCHCGAWRGALGLEPTPELYVEHLVTVFREVWRVLRDDGTLWLNLGDSYVSSPRGNAPGDFSTSSLTNPERQDNIARPRGSTSQRNGRSNADEQHSPNRWRIAGLKPKDLVGIPWRVAFALQADGWYLRSDIIWAKPNPMPESVTDRPTKAHEYLFLLTKSERYYYDAEAIREPDAGQDHARAVLDGEPSLEPSGGLRSAHNGIRTAVGRNGSGRNRRSVWTIATEPYPEAHFATFPTDLVKPCVMAGTSEKGSCAQCGAPWERVVIPGPPAPEPEHRNPTKRLEIGQAGNVGAGNMGFRASRLSGQEIAEWKAAHPSVTTGWRPTCDHEAPTVPCLVLDPFAGSGTTVYVAKELGRRGIGVELKPEYCQLAQKRTRQGVLPL